MNLPPVIDGVTYVLTKQAAALMGVSVPTISRWKEKGWLTPIPESPPGKPIYRLSDVRATEARARRARSRPIPAATQAARHEELGGAA